MAENVNINVTENIDQINVVASEIVEVVDLNLYATTEDVTINVTEDIIQVNVNKITASDITKTSDLINDGEDGVNPFITLNDIPPVEGFVPYTGATQNVDLGEFELKAGQIEFDTTPTGTAGVGVMRWNDSDGTLDLGLKGGNVTLQIGQEQLVRAVNKTATNITLLESNYQAVRVTGAQGQRLKVDLALATNDLLSAETIGLVTETIANNQEGFITISGLVRNINTTGSLQGETWADGDILYLSPSIAGRITNIKPTAPNHLVVIGYVVYAHENNGKIFVKVNNGYELEELHNVTSTNYTTPIDTDSVLTYDVTNSLWKRLSWSNIKSNLKTYFDTIYQTALGFIPENVANKVTDLNTPNNTTYPTTQAVSTALNGKQDTLTNPITGTGANGQVAFFNGVNSQTGNNNLFWNTTLGRLELTTSNLTSSHLLIKNLSTSNILTFRAANADSFIEFNNRLFIGTSTAFSINQSGNIGMGVTNPILAKLHVNGNAIIGASTTTAGARLDVRAQGALSTDIAFRVRNSADTANLIQVNGAGGIEINSTTQGFLPPRMTTTQRNAIATPAAGLIVYDTTDNRHYGYNGTSWITDENVANKSTDVNLGTSDTLYPTQNAVKTYVDESQICKTLDGFINKALIVSSTAQGGGASTIMHIISIQPQELINSLIEIDFIGVSSLGTTKPNLDFRCYVTTQTTLTNGFDFINQTLNVSNTLCTSRRRLMFEDSLMIPILVENAGNQNFITQSFDNLTPLNFIFYIRTSGSVTADVTRYFRNVTIKRIAKL